ncbi:MAG: hypothetical protein Q8911_14860 [Bacillota bacterium]|nr:hypothetical protein [Bacillota bacterium]
MRRIRKLDLRKRSKSEAPKAGGFTLLEIAITMMLFGFLMIYVSQLMNSQLRLYNTAAQKNGLEQKVRAAAAKIVDQVRYFPKTYYSYDNGQKPGSNPPITSPSNAGVYSLDPTNSVRSCLINIDPNPNSTSMTNDLKGIIYWEAATHSLWYKKDGQKSLLVDGVRTFKIDRVPAASGDDLIKIDIIASDSKNDYRLVTWVGLYYGQ